FHDLLGNKPPRRGRSLHRSSQSHLGSAGNQHPHRGLVLFQRSPVDQFSQPILSSPVRAVAPPKPPAPPPQAKMAKAGTFPQKITKVTKKSTETHENNKGL